MKRIVCALSVLLFVLVVSNGLVLAQEDTPSPSPTPEPTISQSDAVAYTIVGCLITGAVCFSIFMMYRIRKANESQ